MKKYLILLFLIISCLNSFSQIPDWLWAKSTGGSNADYCNSITTDANSNIIVTGAFESSTIIFGTDTLTNAGIFIAKYDPLGNVLWAKCAGGNGWAVGNSITTDANNNILITGYFSTQNIIFGTDTLINSGTSYDDVFIVKYNPAGNVLWAKSAGGCYLDWGQSITTDTDSNIIITGGFMSSSIIFGADTLIKTNTSSVASDIFIAKYDHLGNVLWAKSACGRDWDNSNSITTDDYNNIMITGCFTSPTIAFGTDTLINTNADSSLRNIFIVKYDTEGNVLWAKSAGGNSNGSSNGIATDNNNNIMITGGFASPTIIFGTDTLINTSTDTTHIFIVKYDPFGNVLWAKSAGGNGWADGNSIITDNNNNIMITGGFASPTIIFGTDTLTTAGGIDIFIVKYNPSGNVLWAESAGGSNADYSNSITTDANSDILIAGSFYSPNLTFGTNILTYAGGCDIFIAKLGGSVGIFENNAQVGLKIYPNPAFAKITIEFLQPIFLQKRIISVYNIQGQLLLQKLFQQEKIEIDINEFVSGMYFIKLESSELNLIGKFIKQ